MQDNYNSGTSCGRPIISTSHSRSHSNNTTNKSTNDQKLIMNQNCPFQKKIISNQKNNFTIEPSNRLDPRDYMDGQKMSDQIKTRRKLFEQNQSQLTSAPKIIRESRGLSPKLQSQAAAFERPITNQPQIQPQPHRRQLSPQIAFIQQNYQHTQLPTNEMNTQRLSARIKQVSPILEGKVAIVDSILRQRIVSQKNPTKEQLSKYFPPGTSQNVSRIDSQKVCPQTAPQKISNLNVLENVQSTHKSRRDLWENTLEERRQSVQSVNVDRLNVHEFAEKFQNNPDTCAISETSDQFYCEKHLKYFLQRFAFVLNRLRSLIEDSRLENEQFLIQFIRNHFYELINGGIESFEENKKYIQYNYNENATKMSEVNRLIPFLKLPSQKPTANYSNTIIPFDKMIQLYNDLKKGYEIILNKYEHFSTKSWFENCFNALFDRSAYTLNPKWFDNENINRRTIISVMHRLSLILNFLGKCLSRGFLVDETQVIAAIDNMLMLKSPVQNIKGHDRFRYPYHEFDSAERRAILDDFIIGFSMPKKKPTCPPNSNVMCFENMLHLYEGFEAAYWMIEDEFDRRVFSQRHIINDINKSMRVNIDMFPNIENTPFPDRNIDSGRVMHRVIQNLVVFLGILRKELEHGKLIETEMYDMLKDELLKRYDDSSIVQRYLKNGMFKHVSSNYAELEINRLLPAIKIPSNRPLAKSYETPYSDVLRFYFQLQKCALRFLHWVEMDFYSEASNNINWITNRLNECLTKYLLEDEGANVPKNTEEITCPMIRLNPAPEVEDFHDYANDIRPGSDCQYLMVPKK